MATVTPRQINAAIVGAHLPTILARLFPGLVRQESGGRIDARSPAGAYGPTQLMPATARGLGVDPRDPQQNLLGGARYLLQQYQRFHDPNLALAAYNAGPGAVAKYGGVPPYAETQRYVRNIAGSAPARVGLGNSGSGGTASAQAVGPSPSLATAPAATASAPDQRRQLALALLGAAQTANQGGQPDFSPFLKLARQAQQQRAAPLPAPPADQPGTVGAAMTSSGVPGAGRISFAAGADRKGVTTQAPIRSFASRVAAVAGQPLTIGTGTNHSEYTVNGNVSDHWSGNAVDIPAAGAQLIALGHAALIAAGMPAAQARKQRGGLFNVNGHQIIFNTHEGGDHTNHLHISARA